MPTSEEKTQFRRRARARIRAFDDGVRLRAENEICEQLRSLGEPFPIIAAFWPLPSEPDIRPALRHWLAAGTRIYLPVTGADGSMTFHRTRDFEALVPSALGILQPDPAHCEPMNPVAPALVLVPGLAFTPSGQRLGRGGGYYDRYLATLPPDIQTLGIALPCQLFQILPTEPHDITVNQVITEPS